MARWLTIVISGVLAVLFGWGVPLTRLTGVFQPLIVALSIMIAAILVRLNRGMPTLDWKSLDPTGRSNLTSRIVSLTKEYVIIIAIYTILLLLLIVLSSFTRQELENVLPYHMETLFSGFIGGYSSLCLTRMGYIVWRDYDIVKLQKKLIDEAGLKDQYDLEIKSATEKIADIRAAGLRRIRGPDVTPWT